MGLSLNEGDTFHWHASSWSPALWDILTYRDIPTLPTRFYNPPKLVNCFICFFLFQLRKWLNWNFLFVPHFQTWKASKGQTVLVGACVWAITLPVVHKGSGQSTAWKRYATCDMHITWMILHDHVSQHLFEACLKTSEEYGKCSRNDQFIENLLGRYLTSVFKKRSLQPCGRNIQEAPPVGMFNKYMFWKCARVQSVGGSVFK